MHLHPTAHTARTLLMLGTFCPAAGSLLPPKAHAHDFPPEREISLQIEPDALLLFLTYKETDASRVSLLLAQHDLNRNGVLEPAEGRLVAAKLLPVALQGFSIDFPRMRPATEPPKLKWKLEGKTLSIAALTRYPLAPSAMPTPLTLSLTPHAQAMRFGLHAADGTLTPATPQVHLHAGERQTFRHIPSMVPVNSKKPNVSLKKTP